MYSHSHETKSITPVFVLIILGTLWTDVFAGMAVSPLKQWVEVKPGEDAFFSVTIKNGNRGPQTGPCTVYAEAMDFTVSTEGQLSFGEKYKHKRSAVDWISLDDGEFVLQPGETRELKAKVSAPANADGDYWAAIMLTLGNQKKQKTNVNVVLRTASGVFVRVTRRNHIEQASITDINVMLPEFIKNKDLSKKSSQQRLSEEGKRGAVLKINALLKNDGLVAIEPEGKVFLYTDKSRRIGYIPLYASRKQILPGHSRWFSGVMSEQLSAGQYKARVFFDSDSKYGRTKTKDAEFSISEQLANKWAKNSAADNGQMIGLNPDKLELELNPGRFTVAKVMVTNTSKGTISARCKLEDSKSQKDWVEIDTPEFALAPGARRNISCIIRIPVDAKAEDYNASIKIEAERSGLTGQSKNNIKMEKIPVHISVSKLSGFASEGSQ